MPEQDPQNRAPSPELVKKVSDKVYAMLLADLKKERERSRRKRQQKRHR